MGSIKATQIDGDVSVGRHITSGGNADIAGSTHIGHDLVVDGWFEAPNIRGANKGFFLDEAKLQEAYPKPQKGWWAVVGDSIPGPIYVVEKGKWKNSGKTGGASHVYLTDIEKKLSDQANRNTNTDKRLSDLEGKVLSGLARHMVKMSEVGKLGCGINSQSGLEVATHAMMYTTLKVCKDDLIVVDAPQGLVVSAVLKNAAGELREVFATRAKDTLSQMLPSSAVVVPISEDCTMYLNLATNNDRPATKADFEATKVYIYQKNITDSAYSGKNVVWIGTSIPAGEGERKYPEILSRRLGFNLKNKAIGASYFSKASISSDANAPVTCLSMTKAEMTAKWGAKAQLFASFEEVFKAIDANTDIVVFDHGYNDRDAITAVMKAGGFNADLKGTPQGEIQKQIKDDIALLVREIKSRAPRVKIVICGYFTKHHDAWVGDNSLSGTQYVSTKYICDWAAELAESLSVECWPVWQLLDVHDAKYEPMSGVVFRDFCPDDVHPHSEASGKSIRLYADAVERAMLGGAKTATTVNVNIGLANTSTPGLMSATDKEKLDGLSANMLDKYILTPLPKGYTPCKYLQSNGGYIDTGVMGDAPQKMQGMFTAPSAGEYSLLAARKGDTWLSLASVAAGKYQYGYGALAPIKDNGGGESNVTVDLRADAQAGEVNGTKVSGTAAQNVALNLPLYLFACNHDGTAEQIAPTTTRLTSCKIFAAGFAANSEIFLSLKRDFVPCLNPEKVAGLYDLVEGKFYTSANDKAFTAVAIDKGDKELLYNCYEQNLLSSVASVTNREYSLATFDIPPYLRGRRLSFSAKITGGLVDGVDVVKKHGVLIDVYTNTRTKSFVWPNGLKTCIPDENGYIHYDNLQTGETSVVLYVYGFYRIRLKTLKADNPFLTLSEPMLTATPTAKPFEPPVSKWFLPTWLHKYL